MNWNLTELSWLQALREAVGCPLLDWLMPRVSALGNGGLCFILLALALLLFKKTRKYGAVLALALVLDGLLVNVLLKPLVGRVRPFALGIDYPLPQHLPGDASFPSGHTAAAFAAALALRPAGTGVWRSMAALAAVMGFSRLYLMVHYPTDVLAGAVCGALCGGAAAWVGKTYFFRR